MRKTSVESILSALNEGSVRYLVAGGLAVVAHGYLRTTVDVDLIVDLEESNLQRAMGVLSRLGYRPRAPVALREFEHPEVREKWIQEKGLTVFSLHSPQHPSTEIDIFVRPPLDFQRAFDSSHRVALTDTIIGTFVGFEDLIELKRQAGRPQDLVDIEHLQMIRDSDD